MEGIERDKVRTVKDFDYVAFERIPKQKRRAGERGCKGQTYKDVIAAFDIETTRIKEIDESVMYIWQFCLFQDENKYQVIIGRTWEEFKFFVERLHRALVKREQILLVFVHNLSYEFQFLSGIFEFENVFCLSKRKVLKCMLYENIEFRCSYYQTNMSLALFTDKFNVKHKKLSGKTFDYDEERWYYTELTAKQLDYCINDVVGLCEAMYAQMQFDGDNFYTLPLTSTGYVRRDVKRAINSDVFEKKNVVKMFPDYKLYKALRQAFRGGNTHANRWYANKILTSDAVGLIHSVDISSSYPAVIVNDLFPMRFFQLVPGEMDIEQWKYLLYKRKRAMLFKLTLCNVRLQKIHWGCPYLAKDKAISLVNPVIDNGRVLEADIISVEVTDIDFHIIAGEYCWDDMKIEDVYYTRYAKLPEKFKSVVKDYYLKKTALKGVPGQELLYMKSKNKINSCYGMCAQNPVKHEIIFEDNDFIDGKPEEQTVEEYEQELLENQGKHAFLVYQWGVWVTAWARYHLEEGIHELFRQGAEFIYCDTDSIKYIGNANLKQLNSKIMKKSFHAISPDGKKHYMGVFESESDMIKFATLGAKKYAYVDTNNELHLTVAGVNKKEGAKELVERGGIEAFKPGFKFTSAGGIAAVYNDELKPRYYINKDGERIEITKNVCLIPSEYTLGLSAEYSQLLEILGGKYYYENR